MTPVDLSPGSPPNPSITGGVYGVVERIHAGQLDVVVAELGESWSIDGPAVMACWGALAVGLCEQRRGELERLALDAFELFGLTPEPALCEALLASVALDTVPAVFEARDSYAERKRRYDPGPMDTCPWESAQELLSFAVSRAVLPWLQAQATSRGFGYLETVLNKTQLRSLADAAKGPLDWPRWMPVPAALFDQALGETIPTAIDWEEFAAAVHACALHQVTMHYAAPGDIPF